MNELEQRKFKALKNILKSYDEYSGSRERYEQRLHKLENNLKQKSYNKLVNVLEMFADYVCEVLAKTRRVHIKLDKQQEEDLNEMSAELEDIE